MRGWGCVTRAQSLPISSRTAPFRATPASLRRREKGSDDSESDSDSEAEAAPRREELVTHNGGCHCGLVKFEMDAPKRLIAIKCNCSICRMKHTTHSIVPASRFRLLNSSSDFLTCYQFGTNTAEHLFCSRCGISSFYKPRSHPDGFAVNVNCLDKSTINKVRVKKFDGVNWERAYNATFKPTPAAADPLGAVDVGGLRSTYTVHERNEGL